MNLMDYSLLVGIHDVDMAEEEEAVAAAARDDEEDGAEENGVGADDEGGDEDVMGTGNVPPGTPPDSPVAILIAPVFDGDFDNTLEQFAYKCSDRKYILVTFFYL